MSLNLMLTSKAAVYLSGDFRLVSLEDQAPLPDSYDTQKLIPVIRSGWSALVAYMASPALRRLSATWASGSSNRWTRSRRMASGRSCRPGCCT
jgi:hypothetical protein